MDFNHYFFGSDAQEDTTILHKAINLGIDFQYGKTRNGKVLNYKSIEELKELASESLPQTPSNMSDIFNAVEKAGKYSIAQSDLRYIAFPDSANSIAALVGDIYSKFLNQNLIAVDRSAPLATFIEIQVIEWLRELVGYESKPLTHIESLSEVSGMCTTGGHMSNHIAIMTALNDKYPEVKHLGICALKQAPKIILAGDISHYSFSSAMHHLGLGQDNIISIKSSSEFTTDSTDLANVLEKSKESNDVFMVVCVAGNSRTSSIDNIEKIAQICQKYGVWLHVDACHGGSLLFSNYLKYRDLKGIHLADSVSIDPHKGMFVTYPLSYILFKKRDALVHFTRYEKSVRDGSAWDLGYITPFYGSRGFESMKLWLLIKHIGIQNLAKIVEQRDKNAKYAAELLNETGMFQIFHEMTFYRIVFVYFPDILKKAILNNIISDNIRVELKKCIDYYTHLLNDSIYKDGDITTDEFKLLDLNNETGLNETSDRFYVSSVTIANPLLTNEIILHNIEQLYSYAHKYEQAYIKDFNSIITGNNFSFGADSATGPASWK